MNPMYKCQAKGKKKNEQKKRWEREKVKEKSQEGSSTFTSQKSFALFPVSLHRIRATWNLRSTHAQVARFLFPKKLTMLTHLLFQTDLQTIWQFWFSVCSPPRNQTKDSILNLRNWMLKTPLQKTTARHQIYAADTAIKWAEWQLWTRFYRKKINGYLFNSGNPTHITIRSCTYHM